MNLYCTERIPFLPPHFSVGSFKKVINLLNFSHSELSNLCEDFNPNCEYKKQSHRLHYSHNISRALNQRRIQRLHRTRARLKEYNRWVLLPPHLRKTLKDGFTIVYKALLLSCPIPTEANIPTLRTTLIAVKTTLTGIFGASYIFRLVSLALQIFAVRLMGMVISVRVLRTCFEWNGLCGHSLLVESVANNLSLDSKQLKAMAATTEEKDC